MITDPLIGSFHLPERVQSSGLLPFDWNSEYGPIIWDNIDGNLSNIERTSSHNLLMLVQTQNMLFFIDLLRGGIIWRRGLRKSKPNFGVVRDFVITDHAIYMLQDMWSPEGTVMVLLEFSLTNGELWALGFNFREFVMTSDNEAFEVLVKTKRGSLLTNAFRLMDIQSAWMEGKHLYVLVKKDTVFKVFSLPFLCPRPSLRGEFETVVDDNLL